MKTPVSSDEKQSNLTKKTKKKHIVDVEGYFQILTQKKPPGTDLRVFSVINSYLSIITN